MNRVQVFTATRARDREQLGTVITNWIRSYEGRVLEARVLQSSDAEFHCLTVVLLCRDE
jgi:hypothetical protein